MNLNKVETALVLTGLRILQEEMQNNLRRVERFPQVQEIDFAAVTLEDVDDLCEKINLSEPCTPININQLGFLDIDGLGLNTRARNALVMQGVTTIRGLCTLTTKQILGIKNLSRASYTDICKKLSSAGHKLADGFDRSAMGKWVKYFDEENPR